MARPAVYLETTICSYLAAWPMAQLAAAARQQVTHEWWQTRRDKFDLYVSELVIEEASAGDSEAAERRLQMIADLPVLAATDGSFGLQERILNETGFPARARADAGHIAIATVHGMEFLLTWNMTHIANAEFDAAIRAVCFDAGFEPPIICTPDELMGLETTDD
jgi:hypothetical protein